MNTTSKFLTLTTSTPTISILRFLSLSSFHDVSTTASPDDINAISRILSDFRAPHHDIESPLAPFSSKLSIDLVQQVLKRTKNLGFSAHRFFLWAHKFPGFQPNFDTYKILINILGSTKQFPLIWDLLNESRSTRSFELCPEIFWVIFDAYCKANLPDDAIRAFNRMNDYRVTPNLNDLNHLLYLLCRRKFVKFAQEFFDEVKCEFEVSVKSYTILIRGWSIVGSLSDACKVFDEMLERGCVVDVPVYNSLLEALCNGDDLEEGYRMFREMRGKGLEPDACSYSIFIRLYCKRGDIGSVFRVIDRMKRYGLVPNVFTYNCVIKRLCLDEKVDEAHRILDEMVNDGVSPDIWSYNAILAFHCERNEVNRAQRLVSRMEKDKCKPDRHTYNMLLKMLIRIGRFDRVEEVWNSMPLRGFCPSVSTYAVMIHGLLKKKGKLDEACKYFEMMVDEGIPPYSSTIEVLRNRLVGWGMMEKVDILADKMEASSSCSIKEVSKTMRGQRSSRRRREDESSEFSEEEWPFSAEAT